MTGKEFTSWYFYNLYWPPIVLGSIIYVFLLYQYFSSNKLSKKLDLSEYRHVYYNNIESDVVVPLSVLLLMPFFNGIVIIASLWLLFIKTRSNKFDYDTKKNGKIKLTYYSLVFYHKTPIPMKINRKCKGLHMVEETKNAIIDDVVEIQYKIKEIEKLNKSIDREIRRKIK